jgi:uncharacterized membrane protein
MSHPIDVAPAPARPASAAARNDASLTQDMVTTVATVGVIAAGVALLEVALIPGLLIGGVAVLAPNYLPGLRRRLRPLLTSTFQGRSERAVGLPNRANVKAPLAAPTRSVALSRSAIKRAIAKTITFRIIVTTLDFTVNYVVIGELATAAGLSAVSLVIGPLFYLVHETAWSYFGGSDDRVGLALVARLRPDAEAPAGWARFTISRALAKTITFRTIASTVDFTLNFVVVGDFVTAVALSASGFILGPFVYLGHEMAWDRYAPPIEQLPELPDLTHLLPAPG